MDVIHVDGTVGKGWEEVYNRFRANFENGNEPQGATLAVYHKGELVVDLWGGWADFEALRKWKRSTMTPSFSTTKGVCALMVAKLVDDKKLSYDDLVTKYWPEYGQNGKQDTTVRMLVSHEAGLPLFDEDPRFEHCLDVDLMSVLIERQKPLWTPGTKAGYHLATYGWLLDQLVRRVDEKHRTVAKYFHDEIRQPHDIDWYIGLPQELVYRSGRVKRIGWTEWMWNWTNGPLRTYYIRKYFQTPPDSMLSRIWQSPAWLLQNNLAAINNPEIHRLELGSAGGIGTARGLGKVFDLFLRGKLIKDPELVEQLKRPLRVGDLDAVFNSPSTSGWGLAYFPTKNGNYRVGHPGFGGQNVKVDFERQLTICYLTNGLTGEFGALSKPYNFLESAIFDTLDNLL